MTRKCRLLTTVLAIVTGVWVGTSAWAAMGGGPNPGGRNGFKKAGKPVQANIIAGWRSIDVVPAGSGCQTDCGWVDVFLQVAGGKLYLGGLSGQPVSLGNFQATTADDIRSYSLFSDQIGQDYAAPDAEAIVLTEDDVRGLSVAQSSTKLLGAFDWILNCDVTLSFIVPITK